MFNCKKLFKLQIRTPSLILLITTSQDRWIFPSQSCEMRNTMMIIITIYGVLSPLMILGTTSRFTSMTAVAPSKYTERLNLSHSTPWRYTGKWKCKVRFVTSQNSYLCAPMTRLNMTNNGINPHTQDTMKIQPSVFVTRIYPLPVTLSNVLTSSYAATVKVKAVFVSRWLCFNQLLDGKLCGS